MTGPDRRLHVLLVTPGFPPTRGGVEEHVGRLAEQLVAAGHRVTVLTARRGVRETHVEQRLGCTVVVAPAWRTTALSVAPRLLVRALAAGGDADVLHVHSYHALTGLAVLNPRLRGRVVFTPHYHGGGHTSLARLLHRAYGRLAARLFAAAGAVVCVSESEREALERDVPTARGKTVVVPNGVAVERVRAAKPLDGEPPTVLVVSRLEAYKGVSRVVAALADVPAPAQLVVIGDGAERAALLAQAVRLGLADRVRLLGAVEDDELHRWLRTAAVLVSASTHEAFGMAPLEAAAAGTPVVLSDIPAHREITARYLGPAATLVDASDPVALAAAISVRLTTGARVEAEVPDWAEVADATLATYARVVGDARPPHGLRHVARRIGPLDGSWAAHWSAVAVVGVEMASYEQVRASVLRFVETHPTHPLAGTLDLVGRRWVPVAPAERQAHVDRLVRICPPTDPDAVDAEVERLRPPLDSELPFTCAVSDSSVVLHFSHQVGDAVSFTRLVLAIIRADPEALAALEPRVCLGDVGRALLRQPRGVYRSWLAQGVRTVSYRPPPATGGEPAGSVERRPVPRTVDVVLTNVELRALTRWRNELAPGSSVNAVLTSRVYSALVAESVPLRGDVFYSLFDVRSMLGERGPDLRGNLAKSLLLEADLRDPASVDAALRGAAASRRALPALVIGAAAWAVRPRRPSAHPTFSVSRPEAVLTFNSMPALPGLETVPWRSGARRRWIGSGYPTGPDGISVFAIRFRDRMEVSASFDACLAQPDAVRRALARIAGPTPY